MAKHQKKKHLKELGVKCSVCGILCLTQEKLDKHKQVTEAVVVVQSTLEC